MGKTMLVHSTKPETDLWIHIIHSPPVFLNMACWKIHHLQMICPAFRSIHDEDFPETLPGRSEDARLSQHALWEVPRGVTVSVTENFGYWKSKPVDFVLEDCNSMAQWPGDFGPFYPIQLQFMLMTKVRYICGRYGNMLNAWCGTSTLLDAGINGGWLMVSCSDCADMSKLSIVHDHWTSKSVRIWVDW